MARTLLLYDGNNLVYRNNVVTELYTKQGERVSGIFGTIKGVSADLRNVSTLSGQTITDVRFVFDGGRSKKRMELFPEYKGNRDGNDPDKQIFYEEFYKQMDFLEGNLKHFGIPVLRIRGWEADDLVYSISKEAEYDKIILVSTDEDFLQLVNDNFWVFSPIKKLLITPQNFEEIKGVSLKGFLSYKILRGDSSDNIPGIQGIGEVTGKNLVNKYGDLIGILGNPRDLMKSKVTSRIFTPEGLNTLDRNRKLMDLSCVDYSSIKDQLEGFLNNDEYLIESKVKGILRDKQFSALLLGYKDLIQPYKEVNDKKLEFGGEL